MWGLSPTLIIYYASAYGVTIVPDPSNKELWTKYVAVSIAVKDTTLPTIPPFVEPFIVITSFVAAGMKAFLEPSSTAIMIPPLNLSVPSVLISISVAAVST